MRFSCFTAYVGATSCIEILSEVAGLAPSLDISEELLRSPTQVSWNSGLACRCIASCPSYGPFMWNCWPHTLASQLLLGQKHSDKWHVMLQTMIWESLLWLHAPPFHIHVLELGFQANQSSVWSMETKPGSKRR